MVAMCSTAFYSHFHWKLFGQYETMNALCVCGFTSEALVFFVAKALRLASAYRVSGHLHLAYLEIGIASPRIWYLAISFISYCFLTTSDLLAQHW